MSNSIVHCLNFGLIKLFIIFPSFIIVEDVDI